jgi:hypothetical protein
MKTISDNKIAWFIFIASLFIYIPYINSFDNYQDCRFYESGDSWWYQQIVVSIVDDGDLDMSNNIDPQIQLGAQLAVSRDGQLVPKHSILMPILSIPFYLIFGTIGTMYFNLLLTMLLNVFIYKLNRVFFEKNIALITTLLFATGTIILNYSYNYLGSLLSVLLLTIGVYLVCNKKYFVAAVILGFACLAKVSNLLWVFVIAFFTVWHILKTDSTSDESNNMKQKIITILSLALTLLISLLPLFITNLKLYGGILTTGYDRVASLNENYELYIADGASRFNQSIGDGLQNILFHPSLGMIEANPIIVVSLLGLALIYKRKEKFWFFMFLMIILGQFLVFAQWDAWYATEFGNRFLFFSIVLLSPFTGHVLSLLLNKKSSVADE